MEQVENGKHDIDSTEMSDVIINILDYYGFKKVEGNEEDEKWKRGTKYESGGNVPSEVDEKVKQLFLSKLDNLIEAEKEKKKKKK